MLKPIFALLEQDRDVVFATIFFLISSFSSFVNIVYLSFLYELFLEAIFCVLA